MDSAASTTPAPDVQPMTPAQYADRLAELVAASGQRQVRAWHGTHVHRVYRGEDHAEVYVDDAGMLDHYAIVGRDRGFGLALRAAQRQIGQVRATTEQPVSAGPAAPHVAQECAECGRPARGGRVCRDASGLTGWCCATCAAGSAQHRSFA